MVKLIRRNDLEGLQKTYRSSNRYWPIEDLVYFMEVMIQYSRQGFTDQNRVRGPSQSEIPDSRFEMIEVIKEDLDEHGLFSNHNQDSVHNEGAQEPYRYVKNAIIKYFRCRFR